MEEIINFFQNYNLIYCVDMLVQKQDITNINANMSIQLQTVRIIFYLLIIFIKIHKMENPYSNQPIPVPYNVGQDPSPGNNSCEIFGIAGVVVQIILGFLSFSVLVIKRYKEHPKRPWKIWAMDTSKQGTSQLIAHFINVGISLLLSNHLSNDACIWYFITNVLDNTIGVFFCCGVLRAIQNGIMAGRCQQFRSGNYYDIVQYDEQRVNVGNPNYTRVTQPSNTLINSPIKRKQSVISTNSNRSEANYNNSQFQSLQIAGRKRIILISYFAWIIQFLIWNVIVAVCKTILFSLQLLLNKPLNTVSQFMLGWLQPYPTLELVIVIIIIPCFMNALAFWIQDNFLKKSQENTVQQMFKEPLM